MSRHEEVTVKWDKNKKWEEVYSFMDGYMTLRKEVKSVLFNSETDSVPKPGVRYFMTDHGGSKQSLLSEIGAVCINFLFTGLVPFLIILSIIAWYSVRARCISFSVHMFSSDFRSFILDSPDSCKGLR